MHAPPARCPSSRSTGSPSAAPSASALRSTPSAAWQSSASWPPPRRAASSPTLGPSGPATIWVYVGPCSIPSACVAARAASTHAATVSASSRLGQTWASATPNAGGSARLAVGDGQRHEAAVDRERVHGHLRPDHRRFDEAEPRARGGHGKLDRGGEVRELAHERETLLALPVGRLQDAREADPGDRRLDLAQIAADA